MDANFGQDPFKFDIEGEMMEHRSKVGRQIEGFPTPGRHGDWQCLLHQMVSSYLVHHGFRFDFAFVALMRLFQCIRSSTHCQIISHVDIDNEY